MSLFNSSLAKLEEGSSADSIPAPPTADISSQLAVVRGLWTTFQTLLEETVDDSTINGTVLSEVASQSVPLLVEANAAVTLYVTAAADSGAQVPGSTVNVAGRQRMLSQRMSKEALMVSLGVDPEGSVAALNNTMNLFASSHLSLLDSQTTDYCILGQMKVVSDLWSKFSPSIVSVIDTKAASDIDLQVIAELNPILLKEMNAAVSLYAASSTECSPVVSAVEWAGAINVAGRQRMLSQKMSKEFLLVAKGIDADGNKANMDTTIALFSDSLAKLIQGSTDDSLPAPPTQDVADQLFVVKGLWATFKALLEDNIATSTYSAAVLGQVAAQSGTLLAEANRAVTLYVSAATTSGADVPGVTVNIAGRQRMLSQKMSKEALLVALDADASATRSILNGTISLFATSFAGLIDGDSDLGLVATSEPCIVLQMNVVGDIWTEFSPVVQEIASGGDASISVLERIAALNPTLLKEMNKAVSMYASGCASPKDSTTDTSTSTTVKIGTTSFATRKHCLSMTVFFHAFLLTARAGVL
eukprot:TRINITY_DN32516_c0_g1_i1.p1 TRINITY_DN32516_c0_g1~~TRINITY_DN32516_c0_g1_i1.p1  ORF type:complete len:607 (-),score=124.54 TRINITY_DN32516_c0_g1_i1:100-1689(-)